jgi:hypothetical protein
VARSSDRDSPVVKRPGRDFILCTNPFASAKACVILSSNWIYLWQRDFSVFSDEAGFISS